MQPIADATKLRAGKIIYHQPRDHEYVILHRTMVKTGKQEWEHGWCYQEVDKPESMVYSRPDSQFDSDWFLK